LYLKNGLITEHREDKIISHRFHRFIKKGIRQEKGNYEGREGIRHGYHLGRKYLRHKLAAQYPIGLWVGINL